MSENSRDTNDGKLQGKAKHALIMAIGMLVLLWRVVIPTQIGVTMGVSVLIMGMDLLLTLCVIYLSREQFKQAFTRKFTWKDLLKLLLGVLGFLAFCTILVQGNIMPLLGLESSAASDWVGKEYLSLFPVGGIFSMVIAAPLWEETVFRMAGKNLFSNRFVYVLIPSLLFAFIHTVNFSIADNLYFFVSGIVFSLIYLITDDIRISMGVHLLTNLLGAILFFAS